MYDSGSSISTKTTYDLHRDLAAQNGISWQTMKPVLDNNKSQQDSCLHKAGFFRELTGKRKKPASCLCRLLCGM